MDVSFLEPVLAAPGPYATDRADVTPTTEDADTELDLRARAICDRLTEAGAPGVLRRLPGRVPQVVVLPRAAMPGDIPVAAILRYTDASTSSAQ